MESTSLPSTAYDVDTPVQTSSYWSIASLVFFGLVVLSSVAFGFFWLFIQSTSDHPFATLTADLVKMVLMVAAYWVAWTCALAGAVSGLIGVSKRGHQTKLAWLALALNGTFWFVVTAALWIVG